MKLLTRFRRKPLTALDGRNIVDSAVQQTLRSGLDGFVFAALHQPGGEHAEAVIASKGVFTEALGKVLEVLLSQDKLRDQTMKAIVFALEASGNVQKLEVTDGDCPCPICAERRRMHEQMHAFTTH